MGSPAGMRMRSRRSGITVAEFARHQVDALDFDPMEAMRSAAAAAAPGRYLTLPYLAWLLAAGCWLLAAGVPTRAG